MDNHTFHCEFIFHIELITHHERSSSSNISSKSVEEISFVDEKRQSIKDQNFPSISDFTWKTNISLQTNPKFVDNCLPVNR